MLISGIQPFSLLDYPGKVSCIVFTPGCNFRCGFCHNPEFVLPERVAELKPNLIDENAFFNFLDKRGKLLDGVVITGGEPTLMPDLEAFIEKLKNRGLFVKLDSNGNRPEVLSRLIERNMVDYIAMDVKTAIPQYIELVGRLAVPENILKSIEMLKNGSIEYEFRTTLVKEVHRPEILEEMGKLLKGAKKLFLQAFRPEVTLNPIFQSYTAFTDEETEEIANKLKQYIAEVNIRK